MHLQQLVWRWRNRKHRRPSHHIDNGPHDDNGSLHGTQLRRDDYHLDYDLQQLDRNNLDDIHSVHYHNQLNHHNIFDHH